MLICKRSHEVVAVVIVGLKAECDAFVVPGLLGGLDKVLWEQLLLLVEVVASALLRVNTRPHRCISYQTHHINEHLQRTLPLLYKFSCIVLLPLFLLVLSKISLESFLAPWAVDRIGDRSKCGDGFIHARVFEKLAVAKSALFYF